MPTEPNYFGMKLGEALAAGAGHIAGGLEKRYEAQRRREEIDRMMEERMRQEQAAPMMEAAKAGYDFSPAGFQKFVSDQQRRRDIEMQESEAAIDYRKAITREMENKPEVVKGTIGEQAVDRAFAKDYSDYVAGGGFAGLRNNLNVLEGIAGELKTGKKQLSGPIVSLMPDVIRKRTMPESVSVQQSVENVIQQTLRQTLGAQFTEKEGQLFMQRGYDPVLSEAENAKKLDTKIKELKTMIEAKNEAVRYFEENGTLKGFKGRTFGLSGGQMVEISPEVAIGKEESAPISQERIKVKSKSTGKTGTISPQYFDPAKYERIE